MPTSVTINENSRVDDCGSNNAAEDRMTAEAVSSSFDKGAEYGELTRGMTVNQMQLHRERVAGNEVLAWVMKMVLEQRIAVLADGDLAAGLEIGARLRCKAGSSGSFCSLTSPSES
jgi:hypothetical protein